MVETKSKRNLLIWSIILLVMLNISSLATIWYHRYQNKTGIEKVRKSIILPQDRKYKANRHVRVSKLLSRDLDLSPSQHKKFDSIWSYYSTQKLEYEYVIAENRHKMSAIMGQANLDTTEFYGLSDEQAVLLKKLNRSMMAMNIEMRNTLDESQIGAFLKKIKMLDKRKVDSYKRKPSVKRRNN